jgi:hypothetical protein
MAYALDELRGAGGQLCGYPHDATALFVILEGAVLELADHLRQNPKGSIKWPPAFSLRPDGDRKRETWGAELDRVNTVLAQADAMARQEGGAAHV